MSTGVASVSTVVGMCMQVYMQPSGLVSISGVASSVPFLRDFLVGWTPS